MTRRIHVLLATVCLTSAFAAGAVSWTGTFVFGQEDKPARTDAAAVPAATPPAAGAARKGDGDGTADGSLTEYVNIRDFSHLAVDGDWSPAILAGGLSAAPDDDLLFYAPFDGSTTAAVARGAPAATHEIVPRFEPGIRGQALVIGGDPKAKQSIVDGTSVSGKRPRNSVYAPEDNINLQQGTLCFWVKPLDWHGTDKDFNVLFYTSAGDNYFQVYKFFTDDRLLFLRGVQKQWTDTYLRVRDWTPGQWHHLAITWSNDEMRMFQNGHLVSRRQVRFPLDPAARVEPFSVGPGGSWSNSFNGHSLVDEFRIYGRPLSLAEIQSLYLADAAAVEHASGRIVLGERTPAQAGRIEEDSYAFDSTGLDAPGQVRVSSETSRVALSYDHEALYLAVLTEHSSSRSGAARGPRGQETVELYLSPTPAQMWALAFAPDGTVTDPLAADTPLHMESVRVRHTLTNDLWLVETAIPFSALGLSAAPEGATWRFNLLRRYGASDAVVHWAPVAGSDTNRAHFTDLTFDSDAPLIHIGNWRDSEAGQRGQILRVGNAASNATIRAEFLSDTTEIYGLSSRSETLVDGGRETPYRSPVWQLDAGADFSLGETRIVEERAGQSRRLFERKTTRQLSDPLKVNYLYTNESRQLVVSASRQGEGFIRARFLRADQAGSAVPADRESEAWRVQQPLPEAATYFQAVFDLDLNALVPDNYNVHIDYVAPDGAATEIWQQAYVVPGPDHSAFHPYIDPEHDVVPAPWTALKMTSGESSLRISTWGRSYGFGDGVLFDSLITQGEEILAGPAVLRLDNAVLSPTAVETLPGEATDMQATLTQRADLGALRVESKLVTHFDGYCEIDMELLPPEGGMAVQSLSLDIPLRGDAARIVRDAQVNQLSGSKAGAVGDYWHQGFRGGQGGAYFWVGGGRVGLNWLARDLDAWHNRTPDKQVELIREGDVVTVRLNLIDAPLTLDAPRTYRLGFTLTPSRPLDRDILRRRELKEFQMWCQPWQYFAVPDYNTASIDTIRDALDRAEPSADEVFLYLGVGLTSPFTPEFPWFVQEWRGPNGEYGKWTGSFRDRVLRNRLTYSGVPFSVDSFFNWMQHTRAVFFEKAKTPLIPEAHSYYFDTGPNVSDRYREQAINVYRMIRRTGPKARVYTHQGMQRVMPMQTFTDIICGGEGLGTRVVEDGNYFRVLTPEMFRASYCPYLFGIKMVFIDMTVRVLKESHPQRALRFNLDDPEFRRPLLHSYGYCVVHDVDVHDSSRESRPLREAIWAAQDTLGWDADVLFHPYWENETVKRLGDDIGRIMASAYTKDGKMILAVVNDTDEEREVELALDLGQLGMAAGGEGIDVWEPGRTYVLGEHWRDTVPPRGFRMVLWK